MGPAAKEPMTQQWGLFLLSPKGQRPVSVFGKCSKGVEVKSNEINGEKDHATNADFLIRSPYDPEGRVLLTRESWGNSRRLELTGTPWSFISGFQEHYGAVPHGYPVAQEPGVTAPACFSQTRLARAWLDAKNVTFRTEFFLKRTACFPAFVSAIQRQHR